jgi:crotonobetainyl-CoA:carnitine CoA-transferase CaiB-like acyl-CoA transferase
VSNAERRPKRLPLEGVKVVELTHLIAGPYCGMLMAVEGAEVIKVEPPGGELSREREPVRGSGDDKVSAHYAACNRGKESVVLDLKNARGMETFMQLLADADVFLTNLRGAALERLGIHPFTLRKAFPRLVIACISGYGLEDAGDYRDRAGLAMVAEALSGSMGLTRDREGRPIWCGFALGDITAAMTAHSAVLLALRTQERFGEGQVLDLALAECALPMVCIGLARVQMAQPELIAAAGSNNFHGVPFGTFPASDGYITLGVNNDQFWRHLCKAMEQPELGTDERYASYMARARNQREVMALTEAFTRAHTRQQLADKLAAADVPMAPLLTMDDVLEFDYFRGRKALREIEDGLGGVLRMPSDPTRQEDLGAPSRVPRLGEHRDQVLQRRLGLAPDQVRELEEAGAFGTVAEALAGAD